MTDCCLLFEMIKYPRFLYWGGGKGILLLEQFWQLLVLKGYHVITLCFFAASDVQITRERAFGFGLMNYNIS